MPRYALQSRPHESPHRRASPGHIHRCVAPRANPDENSGLKPFQIAGNNHADKEPKILPATPEDEWSVEPGFPDNRALSSEIQLLPCPWRAGPGRKLRPTREPAVQACAPKDGFESRPPVNSSYSPQVLEPSPDSKCCAQSRPGGWT